MQFLTAQLKQNLICFRFSVALLWEWALSFLFDQSTFESMAKRYTAFHSGSYEDEELKKTKGEKV